MKRKSIIIFLILITIMNAILPAANAMQVINKANLYYDHEIDTHILYYNEGRKEWRNVQCGYIAYKIGAEKYPTYCIMPNTNGVDEEGSYTVEIKDLLKDKLIYNVITNGYPYKTPAQLGVETIDDAYVATKLAVKNALLGRDIKLFYKPADERGEKIINAIYEIAEKGKAGNNANKEAKISINEVGNFTENGEYYYQQYSVTADVNVGDYRIESIENFPEGTYIANSNGIKKSDFLTGEKFRIMMPKKGLTEDIKGVINIKAQCKTNPIFHGEAPNSGIQDYAITYKPYLEYESSFSIIKNTNTASVKIIKQDEETSIPIKDVVFGIYKENGEYIIQAKTNEQGIAIFNNLYQGKYTIKEIIANENYIKDDSVYEINTEYNKEVSRTITNTHKKGSLTINKVDKDNNNIVLEGIEFDLINSDGQVIAHLITDTNGEAEIDNINIGKYTLRETKTKENYNLCIDNNIEVKWNETTQITIKNEKKKGQIKIVKQDKENNEIKLEGVEFEIIDSNSNVVDTIKTDKYGEAISKKLPIGEYIIKEISLGTNTEYILGETEYKIKVEDEKIGIITIENQRKKGNLKITKVDKDDKTITLGAIEFDLIDEKGNVIAHLVTDVDGEAYIENINTGTYTLKETKTKREYNLCENTNIVVEWNETSDIVIENEKKKAQVKIIKQDAEKEEIKLEGVKFQIIDINNKVIEEIETDENGEAISSKLLIGEYKIKEIDLGNNTNYLLNNEVYTIQVENQKISVITVENEHKKGDLKIKKIDKDNSNTVLEGVKFKVIDKDGFAYEVETDKNGIAEIKNIRIGEVTIKEVKTNEGYELLDTEIKAKVEYEDCMEITIQNEKKKGQVEIYKVDKENNQLKIPGVEFEILDRNNKIADKIKTNEAGYGISKRLPIGEYYLKEVKTNSEYILNEKFLKINIKENSVLKLEIENEKKKGKIQIIKTSSNDSPISNIKTGEALEGVEFEVFNEKGKLVDKITTDEKGEAISKDLEIGRYKVKEKSTNKYYILNAEEFIVNIEKHNEIKVLEVQNEAIVPNLDIEKTGQQYAEKNEEVKYEFDINNTSNTQLDNFTWTEFIPYEDCKITKMATGIYNENLDYDIYYKTNINDYRLFKTVNSLEIEYLSFDMLELEKEEIITEIKVEYKTVAKHFNTFVKPAVFVKIDNNVKKGDSIINTTQLSGNIEEHTVRDTSSFETIIQEKEIIKKLPKTGC